MERFIDVERLLQREYSTDFEALVSRQNWERGASACGVALSHGLLPNMVHRWLRKQRLPREKVLPRTPAIVPLPVQSVVSKERSCTACDTCAGTCEWHTYSPAAQQPGIGPLASVDGAEAPAGGEQLGHGQGQGPGLQPQALDGAHAIRR